MSEYPVYVGRSRLKERRGAVSGDYVSIGGERFYRIRNYDHMAPFFMSVVSPSDHWLFISSNGGLTAGRQNADKALFPYYTEDKIHDGSVQTGSRTLLRILREGKQFLWEPFARGFGALYEVSRSLYKNVCGNKLMFEEVNRDLDLVFRYQWLLSEEFGFVKHSELSNTGSGPTTVEVLDGIENILPWGLGASFQNHYSCLGDAYKQNELDEQSGVATYALSSRPGDSPEPAEALRATVGWTSCALDSPRLLSSQQLEAFRRGGVVETETRVCGRRGAFFVHQKRTLPAEGSEDWLIVADLEYGLPEVLSLRRSLIESSDLTRRVLEDVEDGTRRLTAIVARADGLQQTGDTLGSAHHFSNVLFNVMRGGVFESSYSIPVPDLKQFVEAFNKKTWVRHEEFLDSLGEEVELDELMERTRSLGDAELLRLVSEYLPISFSRRHGDPSRPWNQFSINVKNRDGSKVLDYQGNWRDIFQNWEALCLSFPGYLSGVITKFVNSTTADGYNPYRVTKDGYDWEAPDPHDPWEHFGYWGDHQLVYLLKLLEHSRDHYPGRLERLLDERRFVYADVPYEIKPYEDLLADPRESIAYDTDRAARIEERVKGLGFDGRYLPEPSGEICRANLTEKLLVPLLAKVSNFVVGAGFWMNTQRPEWNDANNALAGYGVSMVTLCYARRYVSFCLGLLASADHQEIELNDDVARWLEATLEALTDHRWLLDVDALDDGDRKSLLDDLGQIGEAYRSGLYAKGLSGQLRSVATSELTAFFELLIEFFDQTIRSNRRDDGLYHAYNVLRISGDGLSIERLQLMLEGQVAVLSSGALTSREVLAIARALRESELYREDQHSYFLYPDKVLPRFLDKNTIPAGDAEGLPLLQTLAEDGNTELIERDLEGSWHFNGLFRNIRDVRAALERLGQQGYAGLVEEEGERVGELFETVFEHRKFTGRSGTFYGYEGLGCIYWHMVSKLLLALQEACLAAHARGDEDLADLLERYYDVRSGLGFNKAPDAYGAFPTDPYSHTPGIAGARQPGMTGQVKEEILTRLGELGLCVLEGCIHFRSILLRKSEFLREAAAFDYYDVAGILRQLALEEGSLAFTHCQVPIVYRISDEPMLTLHLADGTTRSLEGSVLDEATSREIFSRSGKITRVDVSLTPELDC